jgi:hypothetical protein
MWRPIHPSSQQVLVGRRAVGKYVRLLYHFLTGGRLMPGMQGEDPLFPLIGQPHVSVDVIEETLLVALTGGRLMPGKQGEDRSFSLVDQPHVRVDVVGETLLVVLIGGRLMPRRLVED